MKFLDTLLSPAGPTLRAERFIMRLPRMGDFENWRNMREQSRDFLAPWEPLWAADELTRKAYRLRLSRYRQEAQERSGYTFFLVAPSNGAILGGLTVGQIRRGVAQSCMLGYWMGEMHAGKGLMHEAIDALKPFVFRTEGLHRMEAACLPSNTRSMRLLDKCGFRREGYLRKFLKIAGSWEDHQLYSMLAEDWMPAGGTDAIDHDIALRNTASAARFARSLDAAARS